MFKPGTSVVTILCLTWAALAGDDPAKEANSDPKSPQAATAITKEQAAERRAEEIYVQALIAAKRQCVRELDVAMKSSMSSGNLDEANKIAVTKKKMSADIDQLVSAGKPLKAGPGQSGGRWAYLENLKEDSVTGAQWSLTKAGVIHGVPIVVGGKKFPHGMGLNPIDGTSAVVTYKLPNHVKRLRGAAGINDSGGGPTITFRLVGDDRELWSSKPLRDPGAAELFDVDLTDVKVLELIADCPGGAAGGHVVWLDPQLLVGDK